MALFSWYSAQIAIFVPLSDISYWLSYPLTAENATAKNIFLSHALIWKSHLLDSPGSFFSHQTGRSLPSFSKDFRDSLHFMYSYSCSTLSQFPLHIGLWLWPSLIEFKIPISVFLLSCALYNEKVLKLLAKLHCELPSTTCSATMLAKRNRRRAIPPLRWTEKWPHGWAQGLVMSDKQNRWRQATSTVPQGSVMGPVSHPH